MSTEKLERSEWEGYFDLLSKQLGPENAEVELATLKVGDRIALDSVSLIGLSYNPKDDVFELATAAADHRIQHPRAIYLDEGPDGIRRIEVIDADDIREVIEWRRPCHGPVRDSRARSPNSLQCLPLTEMSDESSNRCRGLRW